VDVWFSDVCSLKGSLSLSLVSWLELLITVLLILSFLAPVFHSFLKLTQSVCLLLSPSVDHFEIDKNKEGLWKWQNLGFQFFLRLFYTLRLLLKFLPPQTQSIRVVTEINKYWSTIWGAHQ